MANILLITCHKDITSHTYRVADVLEATLQTQGNTIKRCEAYDYTLMHPSDAASIAQFDELSETLSWATDVILCTPMWNFDTPAALKNLEDGMLRARKHFYYTKSGMPKGMLQHLRVHVFYTTGGPWWVYNILFFTNIVRIKQILLWCMLCGVAFRNIHFRSFHNARPNADTAFPEYLERLKSYRV